MFQHGRDPFIGDRPIAMLTELREDEHGLRYEGAMFPTLASFELAPLLRARVLGASFRLRVVSQDWVDRPMRAAHNPDGLPERTVRAAELYELGPVVWGAYKDATAGMAATA